MIQTIFYRDVIKIKRKQTENLKPFLYNGSSPRTLPLSYV